MDIKIKPQSPDGLNITIENIVVDTYEEAFEIIEALEKLNQRKKEDIIKEVIGTNIKWNEHEEFDRHKPTEEIHYQVIL